MGKGQLNQVGEPERNLWAAVVLIAWKSLRRRGAQKDSALNFFTSAHSNFPWICKIMEFDLEGIRARAIEEAKKPEQRGGTKWDE